MLTLNCINDDINKTSPLKFEVNPVNILVGFFLDNVWNKRWKPPYYFWATQGCLAVLPANVHLLITDKDIVWPWEGVRQSWRVLLTLRDPSSSSWSSWRGTWRTTQRLLDPANQAWDVSLSFRACIVWTIWMNPNNIQMMLSICFRKPSLMIRLCTSTFYLLTEIKETECFLWIGWIEATLFIEFVRTILSSLGNKGSISVQLSR